jgi:hypothetical protein
MRIDMTTTNTKSKPVVRPVPKPSQKKPTKEHRRAAAVEEQDAIARRDNDAAREAVELDEPILTAEQAAKMPAPVVTDADAAGEKKKRAPSKGSMVDHIMLRAAFASRKGLSVRVDVGQLLPQLDTQAKPKKVTEALALSAERLAALGESEIATDLESLLVTRQQSNPVTKRGGARGTVSIMKRANGTAFISCNVSGVSATVGDVYRAGVSKADDGVITITLTPIAS